MGPFLEKVRYELSRMRTAEHTLRDIATVFQHVRDIAERAGLVAVNASVEAARAGIHGQTFSVAARATRDLAEQSAQIVASTAQVVHPFRQDTYVTVIQLVRAQRVTFSEAQQVYVRVGEGLKKRKEYLEDVLDEERAKRGSLRPTSFRFKFLFGNGRRPFPTSTGLQRFLVRCKKG